MSDLEKFTKLMASFGIELTTDVNEQTGEQCVHLEGEKIYGHSSIFIDFNRDGTFKEIGACE